MEEVYAASWRPATLLGDTGQGLTGFHSEQGAARKTSNCTWDVGVIALQLGHHKAQQLLKHKYDLTGLQLDVGGTCCTRIASGRHWGSVCLQGASGRCMCWSAAFCNPHSSKRRDQVQF